MEEITLTVPASEAFVPLLRSMIAAVAARLDIPYDEIDDLRLAIDEAAAHLISLEPAGKVLSLVLRPSEDRFEIVSSIDVLPTPWPPPGAEHTLTWQILSGLADEADFQESDGRATIRFVKRLGLNRVETS